MDLGEAIVKIEQGSNLIVIIYIENDSWLFLDAQKPQKVIKATGNGSPTQGISHSE